MHAEIQKNQDIVEKQVQKPSCAFQTSPLAAKGDSFSEHQHLL